MSLTRFFRVVACLDDHLPRSLDLQWKSSHLSVHYVCKMC